MPLRAVFFDLGGTLIDLESDRKAHLEMLRSFQQECAVRTPLEELLVKYDTLRDEYVSRADAEWVMEREMIRNVVASLLMDDGISMTEKHWEAFLRSYWREHKRWLRMLPGAGEMLESLSELSVHVGLLSNVDEDFLQLCLFSFPLDRFLDSITTSEEVGVAKPHESIFLRALSKAGCRPREAVHVGDSLEWDVQGAREVGMKTIHISSHGSGEVADYVVSKISEVHYALQRLMGEMP